VVIKIGLDLKYFRKKTLNDNLANLAERIRYVSTPSLTEESYCNITADLPNFWTLLDPTV